MRDSRLEAWEKQLKSMFDEIDGELEEKYGKMFTLHPARPKHGVTLSRELDGLFNIGASFSPGFGSTHGRGYVIDVDMVTLDRVPAEMRGIILEYVVNRIRKKLPRWFPKRQLRVERDGHVFKIVGDLSLGGV